MINEVELGRRVAPENFIEKASKVLKTDFNDMRVITDEGITRGKRKILREASQKEMLIKIMK